MKKIIISSLLLCVSVFAGDEVAMQASMSKMENGLNLIQKGFLHNNKDLISFGVKELAEGNKLFSSKDMEMFLPKEKKHMVNSAQIASNKIDESVAEMNKHLANKEYLQSHESYAKIITACASCHTLVRSW